MRSETQQYAAGYTLRVRLKAHLHDATSRMRLSF